MTYSGFRAAPFAALLASVASVACLASVSLTGCNRKVTPADCTKMLDRYIDMTMGDDPSFKNMTQGQLEAAREMKRALKKAERSYLQVHDQCEREVTKKELDCALSAQNPNEWEACID